MTKRKLFEITLDQLIGGSKENPLKILFDKEESKNEKITLQPHQESFIKQFVFSQLRGAIVYHGVGSGKTLTAVVSAYFYLTLYPNNRVIVISPSALIYNFSNSMVQYGVDPKDKRYIFMTYEKYVRNPVKADDCLLIVDEAHNLRTEMTSKDIKDPETGEIIKTIPKTNARGYAIMQGAFESHKIILLTGTAFVNSIYDIENLLAFIDKRNPLDSKTFFRIISTPSNLQEYFGYRISYVPPLRSKDFPEQRDNIVPLYMTETEEKEYYKLKETGNPNSKKDSDKPNSYYSAERYATNAVGGLENPKINKIVELIKDKPDQKFIVYTVAVDAGVNILIQKFIKNKINYKVISGNETIKEKEESRLYFNGYYNDKIPKSEDPKYKVYDPKTKKYKFYTNRSDRVLIITKAGSEGVDTQNCQNIILLDHQWNDASTEQIIARAIRYKSHFALPESERYVNVYYLLFVFEREKKLIEEISTKGFNDWVKALDKISSKEKGVNIHQASSIDLFLYLLSKTKLKNINEFISNFGGNISLFESYESKLLPLIMKAEEELKGSLTDEEQVNIYKRLLSEEKDNVLKFNFSPNLKDIGKKGRKTQDQYQQFYTSELLVKKINELGLEGNTNNITILEPSAGSGNLIKPLIERLDTEFHIDLIEIDPVNRRILSEIVSQGRNILNLIENRNFLTFGTGKRYDLILMNPPFHLNKSENGLISDVYDYNFVDRAFSLLKEGGRIVAITSTKWGFDSNFDKEFNLFDNISNSGLKKELRSKSKEHKKIEGSSDYLEYIVERLENEPFLGSEGRKINMTVDIWVITKLKSDKDNEILSKIFYLTQQKRGLELEKNTVDFKQEQKQPEPPPPIPAPIEELVLEKKVKITTKKPKIEPVPVKTLIIESKTKKPVVEKKVKPKKKPELNVQEYKTLESLLKKFKVPELKEIINRSKRNIPFKTLTKDKLINKIIINQIDFYDLIQQQPKKKVDVKTKSKAVIEKKKEEYKIKKEKLLI